MHDSLDDLDTIQVWHLEIHERDIGTMDPKLLDRVQPVGRFGHETHVWLGPDEHGDALAQEWMIVDRENPNVPRICAHQSPRPYDTTHAARALFHLG